MYLNMALIMRKFEVGINAREFAHGGQRVAFGGVDALKGESAWEFHVLLELGWGLCLPSEVKFVAGESVGGNSHWAVDLFGVEVDWAVHLKGDASAVDDMSIGVDSQESVGLHMLVGVGLDLISEESVWGPNILGISIRKIFEIGILGGVLKTGVSPFLSEGQLDFPDLLFLANSEDFADVEVDSDICGLAWRTDVFQIVLGILSKKFVGNANLFFVKSGGLSSHKEKGDKAVAEHLDK